MEEVLNQNIVDVFSYMTYMAAKVQAENAQRKYVEQIENSRQAKRR